MYQTIEFADNMVIDVEVSADQGLIDQLLIERGCRLMAQVKRYLVDTADGPVEVADLCLANGTASRRVPCASFRIVP